MGSTVLERKRLQSSGGTHRAEAAAGKKKAKNKIYTPPPPLSLLRLSQLGISIASELTNHELEQEPWSQATVSWRREARAETLRFARPGHALSPPKSTPPAACLVCLEPAASGRWGLILS